MDTDETQNTTEDEVPNDASGVSDSRETSPQQELFAIGEETQLSNTLVEDEGKPANADSRARIPEQRSQFHGGSKTETCDCTMGKTVVAHINSVRCPFCGKVINTKRNLAVEDTANKTEPCGLAFSGLREALVTGLVAVPPTPQRSLDDYQSTRDSVPIDQRTTRAEGQVKNKIPVQSHSETSVQIPGVPSLLTLFVLCQTLQATNEQKFSIYFAANFQKRRVASWIKQMEEHGLKLVSFGEEHLSQQENQHLHQICLESAVTVKFELVKQIHRKFRIRNAQTTYKFPLCNIQSRCQNRIPGATVQVCVESLCEPGEVCQDHLRMILEYGQTIRKMIIPIWSAGQS